MVKIALKPKPKPKPPVKVAASTVTKPASGGASNIVKSLGISAAAGGLAALPSIASAYFASHTVDKVLDNPMALLLLGGVALVVLLK